MTGLNVFSPRQPDGPFQSDVTEGWSMPVGKMGGIRFYVSYSIFVALAVLAGLVAMIQNRPGNADLPVTALVAVGIWALGWLVQVIVLLVFHFVVGYRSNTITVGLLGVESPNRLWDSVQWTASATIMVASTTLIAVFLCGFGFFATHASIHSGWSSDAVFELFRTPGFGLGATESLWLAGTWLCWVQVLCQLFPLPRNLGRTLICSACYKLAGETGDDFQVKLAKRLLQLAAITTLALALVTMAADQNVSVPRWPLLALLSVLLWISSRSSDVRDSIVAYRLADNGDPFTIPAGNEADDNGFESDPGWASQMAESIRMRKKRKKAQAAMRREHEEASDAARLDDVLKIVSKQGTDGLSDSDLALLRRVSENLRRERLGSDAEIEN